MEEIIVREVNLKPLISILKYFKFKRRSALSGEEKECMLYTKDEMFYIFIEHSKSMLNVECSVYIESLKKAHMLLSREMNLDKRY